MNSKQEWLNWAILQPKWSKWTLCWLKRMEHGCEDPVTSLQDVFCDISWLKLPEIWWFTQTWFYPSALLRQNSRPYFWRSSWKDVSQNHRKPIFRTSPWRLASKKRGGLAGVCSCRKIVCYLYIKSGPLNQSHPGFLGFIFVVGFVGLDILVSWHLVNDLQY